MRSVRTKFLAVIALCLLPMAVATRIFYFVSKDELQADAVAKMKNAGKAFSLELQDDIATLEVAARLIATDPDLRRELAAADEPLLYEHIDDFTGVYPGIRVYLTDPQGTVRASSHQRHASGSLVPTPELRAALQGGRFAGISRLILRDGGVTVPERYYSYVIARPIQEGGSIVGALLATFPLDRTYLDNTEQKEGLALSLRIGSEIVAFDADHPAPDAELATGQVLLKPLPDGRTVALASFTPAGIGAAPGPVSVVAAEDVTKLFRDSERFLRYRLLVLGAIALAALAAGIAIANPMARAVGKIAAVLPGVAEQRYEKVEGIRTGDELQQLAESYNSMIAQLGEAARLREALGKYLSRAARDAVEHGRLQLGGTTLGATVLFCDIRGFTTLSETMEPEKVLQLLNRYFTEMVGAVVRHRGIVDKFIGDCIMAVWGPPEPGQGDALDAIRAAVEMRDRLARLNLAFAASGLPQLHTGIGIHSGQVVAGNMGAEAAGGLEGKMEYTVIGDTVNLASRLESMTKELHADIVLSEDTYQLVAGSVEVEALRRIQVRGRARDVGVYRLVGLRAVQATAAGAVG
ncbi:MAG: adenylate/guanylate cyclase domain-containing protein [Myxococcales bacterium]